MGLKVFKGGQEIPIRWGKPKTTFVLADGTEMDVESEEFRELMRKRHEEANN